MNRILLAACIAHVTVACAPGVFAGPLSAPSGNNVVDIDALLPAHDYDFSAALAAAVNSLEATGGNIYLGCGGESKTQGKYTARSRTPVSRSKGDAEIAITTRNGQIVVVAQSEGPGDLISLLGANNLRIENLRLIGDPRSTGNGVMIRNCHDITLNNVACIDAGSVGIRITSASETTLSQVRVRKSKAHSVRISNCTDVTLEEVSIVDAGGYGIGVQSGEQLTRGLKILNSSIVRSRGDGIDIKGQREEGPPLVLIDGLEVLNSGGSKSAALDLRGHVAVRNVRIALNPGSTGLRFRLGTDIGTREKTNGWAGYGTAEHVTIDSESRHGIGVVVQSGGVTLSDCSINGPVEKAIEVYEWANKQRPVVMRGLSINGRKISEQDEYLAAGGAISERPKLVFE